MVEKYPKTRMVTRKIPIGINKLRTWLNFTFDSSFDNFFDRRNGIIMAFALKVHSLLFNNEGPFFNLCIYRAYIFADDPDKE